MRLVTSDLIANITICLMCLAHDSSDVPFSCFVTRAVARPRLRSPGQESGYVAGMQEWKRKWKWKLSFSSHVNWRPLDNSYRLRA